MRFAASRCPHRLARGTKLVERWSFDNRLLKRHRQLRTVTPQLRRERALLAADAGSKHPPVVHSVGVGRESKSGLRLCQGTEEQEGRGHTHSSSKPSYRSWQELHLPSPRII